MHETTEANEKATQATIKKQREETQLVLEEKEQVIHAFHIPAITGCWLIPLGQRLHRPVPESGICGTTVWANVRAADECVAADR